MPHLSREETSSIPLNEARFNGEGREPTRVDTLSNYAISVNLDTIHPARLFVVRAALHELMSSAQPHEVVQLPRAFFRTLPQAKKVTSTYKEALCNNDYCKTELLEALNFTPLTPSSIEKFYSFIISPELFNSSALEQKSDPEIPSHCFDFISFCPMSIVQAIAAKGAESISSFHDLGCGPGSIMFIVATLTDAKVSGTEHSSVMCQMGKDLANQISRTDIEFINRDLEDKNYSFEGYQYYYCYSPFIWELEEAYVFARRVASSVNETTGELWLGDYLPMCEVIEEVGALKKIGVQGRLARYHRKNSEGV